ncbi:MAG TPA: agmatinase [Candidatus Lokiarchaeia archaeon]|nr:agmatinase [Candidatus Lokiarchaeia archaeon]
MDGIDVDMAVIGAPLDQGSFNRTGARLGPRGIRDASQLYGTAFLPDRGMYDVELGRYKLANTKIVDLGDIPVAPTLSEENLDFITDGVKEILQHNVFPVVLGGDHSITYPVIRAFEDVPLDIVHFDTHMDFGDDMLGVTISHANPIKRSSELEQVKHITQIGIRGLLNPDLYIDEAKEFGARVITASEVIKAGTDWVVNQIPEAENIYVTFDIDALDPSVAPGTGTPEPGGLTYLQMREMLTALPQKGKIVGFDLVEVNPLYDPAGTTAQVAARLILDFLAAVRD